MQQARRDGSLLLIESTCNQVNQFGGYTDQKPADFAKLVRETAAAMDFPFERIILGGDHLGPQVWRKESSKEAMEKACVLARDSVLAGYTKIHLDASMPCADDAGDRHRPLADEIVSTRAAELCAAAESAHRELPEGSPAPLYVIGTEVPIPGGGLNDARAPEVTRTEDLQNTLWITKRAFGAYGLESAWERVIAVVVQPGVEFASTEVIPYKPEKAARLVEALASLSGFVFEAHSTDYQPAACLDALVSDGFGILKVGPWLTFALREALYGLDCIARVLDPASTDGGLPANMEALMLKEPGNWRKYYQGGSDELRLQRHFSFSDRIRYYWPHPEAQAAVGRLFAKLGDKRIPEPLISQYLGGLYPEVIDGSLSARPRELALGAVLQVLRRYDHASSRN